MATVTVQGVNGSGFNMTVWTVGSIVSLMQAVFGNNSATVLDYNGGQSRVIILGSFSNFDANGDPQSGTATDFLFVGPLGTIEVNGLSLNVATLYNAFLTGNTAALNAAVFGGADTFTGSDVGDVLMGYSGDDTINGGAGSDELYGETHPFSNFTATAGNDVLNGGSGNDTLHGGAGNDTLNGGDDNDILFSGTGVDTIDGGAGIDSLTIDRSAVASAISFNLTTMSTTGAFYDGTTIQNVESTTIRTGSGADTVTIDGDFAGAYVFDGGTGADHVIINLAASSTPIVWSQSGSAQFALGSGSLTFSSDDRLTVTGGSGNDRIVGQVGDDILAGGIGNDEVYGNFGNDTINGGDGADLLDGGEGTDTINGGAGDDRVRHNLGGADQLDGGDGFDIIDFNLSSLSAGVTLTSAAFASPTGVTFSNGAVARNFEAVGNAILTSGNDSLTLTGAAIGGNVFQGGDGTDQLAVDFSSFATAISFEKSLAHPNWMLFGVPTFTTIFITQFETFAITGGAGADRIDGGNGNDVLNGGDGADRLMGNGGSNVMNGGGGDDYIWSGPDPFAGGAAPIDTIDGGAGVDTVYLNLSNTSVGQTFDLALMRSAAGQTLSGGGVVRNAERFQIDGGNGNDTFLISGLIDAGTPQNEFYLNGLGGTDTVIADFSALNVTVTLTGNRITIGSGQLSFSAENVTITGGSAADALTGGAGAQTLNGGGGGDVLYGGSGDFDVLNGGDGSDTLQSFSEGGTNTIMDGGAGVNSVLYVRQSMTGANTLLASDIVSATGVTLSDGTVIRNVERFDLTLGSGNDTITVTSALTGQNHRINAGTGFDRGFIDLSDLTTAVTMSTNSVTTSAFSMTLLVDQLFVTSGSGNDGLVGSVGDDTLNGGDGSDTISGEQGADLIDGGLGNDQLNGASGDDTINGGDGVDTLIGHQGVDTLNGGAGDDIIYGDTNGDVSLVTSDTLNGGDGNDRLDGGGHFDFMSGGAGNDTYVVNHASDATTELEDAGLDTVEASVSWTLAANVENLLLLTGGVTGTGNAANNVITGNAVSNTLSGLDGDDALNGADGADTLNGGVGADAMSGGAGNDTFIVDHAGDTTLENSGGGADSVQASLNWTLGAEIENLTLTAGAVGTGNALANVITGNTGANTLNGLDGNDTLNGGDGVDTLVGGLGVDTINGGAGDDIITWVFGDGNGVIDGGADNDTFNITGNSTSNILRANYNGSVLVAAAGNTLASVEVVNAAMGGGGDLLEYVAASSAVTVNLTTGAASGFATLSGLRDVTGGGGNDALTGSAAINKLEGGDGDDTLFGLDGNDQLKGGAGADTFYGGLGSDNVEGGAGDDQFIWNWGDGNDVVDGGADTDTVTFNGTAGSNLFKVGWDGAKITGVMSNPLTNIENVVANTGGGGDWLMYTQTLGDISVNLALGTASGFISISGVSHIQGGTLNDTLFGNDAFNKLEGGDGNDTLSAGADNDLLKGGAGDDTLTGGLGTDTIEGGDGNDTILWAWGDGPDFINGGANTDSATFVGSNVANLFKVGWNGSVLTDVMGSSLTSIEAVHADGGGGGDWIVYQGTAGATANLTTLTADGFASIANFVNLQGGAGNDVFTGDSAANKFIGGDGNDTITGLGGNDTITGGLGADTFVYAAGAGSDTIADFDANATGGQDLLDITGFGITALDFGARVSIFDAGANTIVTIDGSVVITLNGVDGNGDNAITSADFLLS